MALASDDSTAAPMTPALMTPTAEKGCSIVEARVILPKARIGIRVTQLISFVEAQVTNCDFVEARVIEPKAIVTGLSPKAIVTAIVSDSHRTGTSPPSSERAQT